MDIILVILLSYISGSIPFGLILTKVFLKKNITEIEFELYNINYIYNKSFH